jgi:hypothetical protein
MERRSFFGTLFAPLLLPLGFTLTDLAPLRASDLPRLSVATGQTIEDITISFGGAPCDAASLIEFYRASNPTQVFLNVALNHRGLFRWGKLPNMEPLILLKGDALKWRIAQSSVDSERALADLHVWTLGRDLATNRTIVNQSEYLNA